MPPITCYVCTQTVYLPEQLKACDKIFHKMCFKCGITSGNGCKRRMDLTEYVDNKGEPFCKFCYQKLFGAHGHRHGTSGIQLDTNVTSNESSASAPNVAGGKVETESHPRKESNPFLAKDKERRASLGKTPAPTPPKPKAAAPSAGASGTGAPKCAACAKSVFAVEETKALGRLYHKRCFRCGGENGNGCNKVLSLIDYVDGKGKEQLANQPYCKNCHTKLYGPKGHNQALGSSITNEAIRSPPSATKSFLSEVEAEAATEDASLSSAVDALKVDATESSAADGDEGEKVLLQDAIENSVFNAASKGVGPSDSPVRRTSLKVGGNLKFEVHKEVGYAGDGDEVDDGEWN